MCHMRRRIHVSYEDTCGLRSTWYLCQMSYEEEDTRTRGVGVRESLLGPCSLLMVALDASKNIRTSLPPLHTSPSLSISLSGAPSVSLGHRAFVAAETPPGPQCTSQAQHHL
jgi:hypothetical protein